MMNRDTRGVSTCGKPLLPLTTGTNQHRLLALWLEQVLFRETPGVDALTHDISEELLMKCSKLQHLTLDADRLGFRYVMNAFHSMLAANFIDDNRITFNTSSDSALPASSLFHCKELLTTRNLPAGLDGAH
jgi:hypothetical protein